MARTVSRCNYNNLLNLKHIMKKLFAPLVLLAISGILLSSCNNSSKLSLTKRHYRSGYYVDFGSKSQTTTPASVSKVFAKHQMAPNVAAKPENHVAVNTSLIVTEKEVVINKMVAPQKTHGNNRMSANPIPLTQKVGIVNTWATNDISGSIGDGIMTGIVLAFPLL